MLNYDVIKTDVLVVGSGVAGLCAAYAAACKAQKVTVITKSLECSSDFVLGFNCVAASTDSVDKFSDDMINGGGEINDKALVRALAEKSVRAMKDIESSGLEFDKNEDGGYNLLKPLGCSVPRLVHISNKTGKICGDKLKERLAEIRVEILSSLMLTDILTDNGKATGAVALKTDEEKAVIIFSKAVVIATGGIHIATDSTYAPLMTADGYAAAYNAGAYLVDLEFIQYEPCRCVYPKKLGISTTLLAKGGKITNSQGKRFLLDTYENEGQVTKDMLARLIYKEIIEGRATEHGGVYLDLTDVDEDELINKHSLYYKRFITNGIDLTKEKIEVAPSAHSFMGGIVINEKCQTEVAGLFAAGEVTGGIHGANRVGGNAGTEIFVFGNIAGESAAEYSKTNDITFKDEIYLSILSKYTYAPSDVKIDFSALKAKVRAVMAKAMGPIREEGRLNDAIGELNNIKQLVLSSAPTTYKDMLAKKECENLLLISEKSCASALLRKESRGVHFRSDYPNTTDEFKRSITYGADK